jgi:hypothetical protein
MLLLMYVKFENMNKPDNDYEDNVILFFYCACLAPLNTLS